MMRFIMCALFRSIRHLLPVFRNFDILSTVKICFAQKRVYTYFRELYFMVLNNNNWYFNFWVIFWVMSFTRKVHHLWPSLCRHLPVDGTACSFALLKSTKRLRDFNFAGYTWNNVCSMGTSRLFSNDSSADYQSLVLEFNLPNNEFAICNHMFKPLAENGKEMTMSISAWVIFP